MYGRPMWNLAILYRPLSMASATAEAGERGRCGSMGNGDMGDAEAERDTDTDAEAEAGTDEAIELLGIVFVSAVENWRGGGRLMRHCSSWWCSSVLMAGRGKVPESALEG